MANWDKIILYVYPDGTTVLYDPDSGDILQSLRQSREAILNRLPLQYRIWHPNDAGYWDIWESVMTNIDPGLVAERRRLIRQQQEEAENELQFQKWAEENERLLHMYYVPKWNLPKVVQTEDIWYLVPEYQRIGQYVQKYDRLPSPDYEDKYFETELQADAYEKAYWKKYDKLHEDINYSPNGWYATYNAMRDWRELPWDAVYDMKKAFNSKYPIIFDPNDERKGDLPFENRRKLAEDLGLGHEVNHIEDMYLYPVEDTSVRDVIYDNHVTNRRTINDVMRGYSSGGRLIPRRFKLK